MGVAAASQYTEVSGVLMSETLHDLRFKPFLYFLISWLTSLSLPELPDAFPVCLSAYAEDVSVFITSEVMCGHFAPVCDYTNERPLPESFGPKTMPSFWPLGRV